MGDLKTMNKHLRDEYIVFDEGPHIYYVHNKPISTSVTTLVHEYFSKFDSDKIINNMMNSRYWYKNKYFGMTKEEIQEQWAQNGLDATTEGTKLHKTIEQYYNEWELEHPNTPEFKMFIEFARDHASELTAYRTEWEVYDQELDLAGSIDMIFKNNDGTYSIYDWKRTKEIKTKNGFNKKGLNEMINYPDCNYIHYSLQLNTYKYILEKHYDLTIKDMFLICCHPNYETYKKIEVVDLQKEVYGIMESRKGKLST